MPDRRDIAVIGLGTFGTALAREMSRMGDRVTGIDRDAQCVGAMDGEIDAVMQADATDAKVLNHAGIGNFDSVIVAIGDDMQSSLLTTLAVMQAGCTDVYVKAQTPEHARILKAMGVNNLLEPEASFALHLSQLLHNPHIVDFLNLGNGNYIATINAPSGTACSTVADLPLAKYNLACIGVDIGERILTGELATHALTISDRLILAGKRADLRRFALHG
ncbi:potassium channel family protein [Algimonas porphyrae]|uniref:Potassium transporter TrkA n=1 Tax=Algimonas porphyrae TaxID=1128113 RepID=A0ABQ5UZP9_9PROT|nr:TrkA family potassium uptake protein [Algimonas porphyrae]GLQ20760.1 potassium transporter TrkA [Algimonas porphyrae]